MKKRNMMRTMYISKEEEEELIRRAQKANLSVSSYMRVQSLKEENKKKNE